MNEDLEILNSIHPVEAPRFLFTRIAQKIRDRKAASLPPHVTYSLCAAVLLIIAVNTALLFRTSQETPKSDLTKSMHLFQDNSLYK